MLIEDLNLDSGIICCLLRVHYADRCVTESEGLRAASDERRMTSETATGGCPVMERDDLSIASLDRELSSLPTSAAKLYGS